MASEITEEEDYDSCFLINTEAQKQKIRQLISYQKQLYFSSSSSSSTSSVSSSITSNYSFSSSEQSRNLLKLMKQGSTSLRRLFDMEHTSLANHLYDYSGSPIIKPIPLWGSDTDDGIHEDPWTGIRQYDYRVRSETGQASDGSPMEEERKQEQERQQKEERKVAGFRKQKLTRKKSFSKLPSFRKWKPKGFRFRLRFRFKLRLRLKMMICGRLF